MLKSKNIIPILMLSVSVIGFSCFYLVPFFISAIYALTDNPINLSFVGFKNFIDLFQNKYFMRGLTNTFIFIAISIPLNMVFPLFLAMTVNKLHFYQDFYSIIFLIPLVVPSATTAFFWKNLFDLNGPINKFLMNFGIEKIDWFQSNFAMSIMIFIFLWKNLGYNMVLFISGLNNIPTSYYECADIEGANGFQKFFKITSIYLIPTVFIVFIMILVNSFKIFKEIYLITGSYPHESIYMLQHYMNNMFLSLNYPKLASGAYILAVIVIMLVSVLFKSENKISENLKI